MIWCKFNNFVMQLDKKPKFWEDRATLFGAYLIKNGIQSATLQSYISAIKGTLIDSDYQWDDNRVLLNLLTRVCHRVNDHVRTRLPIHINLLELMIFELQRLLADQPFLVTLYKAWFLIAYYSMFRVSELAFSEHSVKARDVHIAKNKNKMMFVLYSSKMHDKGSRPQKIKIVALTNAHTSTKHRFFCPFTASQEYLALRGNYHSKDDPFFIHRDHSPLMPVQVRNTLRRILSSLSLNASLYNTHSFRIGRTSDLIKRGESIEKIKLIGRWKSNTVFKYIRQ